MDATFAKCQDRHEIHQLIYMICKHIMYSMYTIVAGHNHTNVLSLAYYSIINIGEFKGLSIPLALGSPMLKRRRGTPVFRFLLLNYSKSS